MKFALLLVYTKGVKVVNGNVEFKMEVLRICFGKPKSSKKKKKQHDSTSDKANRRKKRHNNGAFKDPLDDDNYVKVRVGWKGKGIFIFLLS